ncbi:MAG: hypothetical protein IKY18_02640 [Oscillospiraceae bacterium]|nr:hypothetical protein [Oscillospiraceae bacterium]
MFCNIGGKIKGLARIIFIIEAVFAAIAACIFLFDEDTILIGFLILIGGFLSAWISTWILFGFGELIEKTTEIANNTKTTTATAAQRTENFSAEQCENVDSDINVVTDNNVTDPQPQTGICQLCNSESHLTYCKIKDNLGIRYRNICDECIAKHNAIPAKK